VEFQDFLEERLNQRKQDHLYRHRKVLQSACGPRVNIDDKEFVAFCANDYLGLANHPLIIQAAQKALEHYGVGSGASHLVSGHSAAHHQLEEELAEFTGRNRALVFSSGYMANMGVISALLTKGDRVLEDKLNHASLLDGGLLSGARFQRYLHNDMQSLESYLAKEKQSQGHTLVVTDGVFSMDGDVAPLNKMVPLCEAHQAVLMVDDAHGIGVIGEKGGGCAELFKLNQEQLPVLVGTFGKALGTSGAFVAGSDALIENLIQFSRSYIYTTAMPPALAVATRCSLRAMQEESWRREQLHRNIQYFRSEAQLLGLSLSQSQTPVQPVVIGESGKVNVLAQGLEEEGILVGAIRPPTVPEGTARLRITFSAAHSQEDIDKLLDALQKHMRSLIDV